MKPKIWSNFGASVHSDSATICISLSNFTVKDQSFCFRPCESYSPGSFFPAHNADFPGKDTTANRSRAAKSRSRILWAWEASLPSKVERAGPAAQVLISENRGTRSAPARLETEPGGQILQLCNRGCLLARHWLWRALIPLVLGRALSANQPRPSSIIP